MFQRFVFAMFLASTLALALVGSPGKSMAVMLPGSGQNQPVTTVVQPEVRLIDQPVVLAAPLGYTLAQTGTEGALNINLDTDQLFSGAQLIIDALSSPYLLIAGLGLGVAILAAILKAVQTIRL